RLDEALHGAKHLDELRTRLNQFKDRELFLIDLDHILSSEHLDAAFQMLSERLVLLAENLVAAAAQFVYRALIVKYGQPTAPSSGNPGEGRGGGPYPSPPPEYRGRGQDRGASYAIFGLGKLGGVALGYASDIELLFLFDSEGKTSGGPNGSIANSEF